MRKRLAIVSTHPVQYNAPWFRMLAEHPYVDLHVFYTWHGGDQQLHDPGFGQAVKWDIPLTDGYEYTVCPPSQPVQKRTFWNVDSPELMPKLLAWNPDCVLVIGWNFRSHVRCMRQCKGKLPVWFRGDSTLLDKRNGMKSFARTAVLRRIYANIDKALAVGQNNRDYFLAHGLSRDQVEIVPHAIANERFADPVHDQSAVDQREEIGFGENQTVVSFIGKLEPKKAPLQLVSAFRRAWKERDDLRLLIVGSGPLEAELSVLVADDPRIVRLPFQNQSQIPTSYRIGDVTILPSLYNETWGLCLNESMASGRAVIASDRVGACLDLVCSETGYRYSLDDGEQLDEVLTHLPPRSDLLRIGGHCQEFIRQWSFQHIVNEIALLVSQA